jgi:hypothetical protein
MLPEALDVDRSCARARPRDNEADVGLLDNEMDRELLELGYGLLLVCCLLRPCDEDQRNDAANGRA